MDFSHHYSLRRSSYLAQIKSSAIRHQLERLDTVLDVTLAEQAAALREAKQLGRPFVEINEFIKMPGVGPMSAVLHGVWRRKEAYQPDKF
ncbi:hypothetical protein JXQ70_05975 [bacterium]|nr:hypothetical protein [bacterium]